MNEIFRSLAILHRRGLIGLPRLAANLRTLRLARAAGPFAAMISDAVDRDPNAVAIVGERATLTYGDLDRRANAFAHELVESGVCAGDIVGLLCREDCGMVISLIALGRLGCRIVLLNTGFGAVQLHDVVRREKVTTLVLDGEFRPQTDDLAGVRRVFTEGGGDHRPTDPPPLPARPGGMVLLTSGTTGVPRGAPRTRMSPLQSAQLLDRIPLSRGGALVLATPLFHGTGIGQFVMAMTLGKKVILRRRTEARRVLADVAEHRADTLIVVPTVLQRLVGLGREALSAYDTSSLRIIVCGGSVLPPDLCRQVAAAFGDVLYNVYGSTEVANAAVATPAELRRAPGTVGRPLVGCRIALYDESRRPVTEPGRPGTIFAGNGLSFSGYTDGGGKETVDGLVCTGDVGHFDADGLLFIDGRADEMIVSGGENVFPAEVENLLLQRPDVRDAAVVGVPDADFGQRLRAFVVLAPGAEADAAAIQDHVKVHLARFKVPRDVVFVAELPRTPTGKLLRRELSRIG